MKKPYLCLVLAVTAIALGGCGRETRISGKKGDVTSAAVLADPARNTPQYQAAAQAEAQLLNLGVEIYPYIEGDVTTMTARFNSNYRQGNDAAVRAAMQNFVRLGGIAISGIDMTGHPALIELMWKVHAAEPYQNL